MAIAAFNTTHFHSYDRVDPKNFRAELAGKTVFITGGGAGIGKEISRSYARAGVASIILASRTESSLKQVAEDLASQYPNTSFSYVVLDLASPSAAASAFEKFTSSPDILVNNAGYLSAPTEFLDIDMEEWWTGFVVNILGTTALTQAYLRHRKQLGATTPGVVVNLNTGAAYNLMIGRFSAYGASKAGALRASELIAASVPKSLARLISVHPGVVQTAMAEKAAEFGHLPRTDAELAANFIVWTSTKEAEFLGGRFAHVNWDVDALVEAREAIERDSLLTTAVKGLTEA